jgi:hypothetical protein
MGSFSIWHWFIFLILPSLLLVFLIVPAWRIVSRAGFSGVWSLLLFVPFVNFVMLWVFAFVRWPRDGE